MEKGRKDPGHVLSQTWEENMKEKECIKFLEEKGYDNRTAPEAKAGKAKKAKTMSCKVLLKKALF